MWNRSGGWVSVQCSRRSYSTSAFPDDHFLSPLCTLQSGMGDSVTFRTSCRSWHCAGILEQSTRGLGTEKEQGFSTGAPCYTGWRNRFLGSLKVSKTGTVLQLLQLRWGGGLGRRPQAPCPSMASATGLSIPECTALHWTVSRDFACSPSSKPFQSILSLRYFPSSVNLVGGLPATTLSFSFTIEFVAQIVAN